MNIRMISMMALVAVASCAISIAGGVKCDEKATVKKAKSSSCCSTTSNAAKKMSDKECSTEESTSCSTTAVKVKKTSASSSCCSMKAKDVKSTAVAPTTEKAAVAPTTEVKCSVGDVRQKGILLFNPLPGGSPCPRAELEKSISYCI